MSTSKNVFMLNYNNRFDKKAKHSSGTMSEGSPNFSKYGVLMSYALFLLGRRRLTSREMILRLEKRVKRYEDTAEENEEVITKVVERLKELKYINDTEYLSDFVENRLKLKPKGIHGLKFELKKKGIKNEDIDKYFSENKIDETGIALELAERKMKSLSRVPKDKQKSRLIMFLTSRGFKGQTVYDTIEEIFK